jgi:hypothetical protein
MKIRYAVDDGHRTGSLPPHLAAAPRLASKTEPRDGVKAGNEIDRQNADCWQGPQRSPVPKAGLTRPTRCRAIDRPGTHHYTRALEPVAQVVEHLTFNQVVLGSSPSGLTKIKDLASGMICSGCSATFRQLWRQGAKSKMGPKFQCASCDVAPLNASAV